MSISHTSSDGSPSRIHSAICRPIPPAPARPCAQKPAATKNPPTSVSPRQNSLSGVNASGPLMSRHLDVLHHRHAPRGVPRDLLEPRPVLFEQAAVEVGGDPVDEVVVER